MIRKTPGEYNEEIAGNKKIPKTIFKQGYGGKNVPDKVFYMGQMSW